MQAFAFILSYIAKEMEQAVKLLLISMRRSATIGLISLLNIGTAAVQSIGEGAKKKTNNPESVDCNQFELWTIQYLQLASPKKKNNQVCH